MPKVPCKNRKSAETWRSPAAEWARRREGLRKTSSLVVVRSAKLRRQRSSDLWPCNSLQDKGYNLYIKYRDYHFVCLCIYSRFFYILNSCLAAAFWCWDWVLLAWNSGLSAPRLGCEGWWELSVGHWMVKPSIVRKSRIGTTHFSTCMYWCIGTHIIVWGWSTMVQMPQAHNYFLYYDNGKSAVRIPKGRWNLISPMGKVAGLLIYQPKDGSWLKSWLMSQAIRRRWRPRQRGPQVRYNSADSAWDWEQPKSVNSWGSLALSPGWAGGSFFWSCDHVCRLNGVWKVLRFEQLSCEIHMLRS